MYIPFNGSKSGFNIATSEPRRVVVDTSIQFLFVKRWMLAFIRRRLLHISHIVVCCGSFHCCRASFCLSFSSPHQAVHHHGRASLSRGCLSVDLLKSSGRHNLLKLRLSSRLLHFYYSNALRVDADDIQQTSARLRFKCALLPWSVSEDGKKKKEKKSEEIETIETSANSCFFSSTISQRMWKWRKSIANKIEEGIRQAKKWP